MKKLDSQALPKVTRSYIEKEIAKEKERARSADEFLYGMRQARHEARAIKLTKERRVTYQTKRYRIKKQKQESQERIIKLKEILRSLEK